MSLLMADIIRSKAPSVAMVAYVDDMVLLGPTSDVTQTTSEIQTETAVGGLKLQKAKTQVWSPTHKSIDDEPLLRTLQGRMGDKRGILVSGETVSEEPEDAIPIGNEAFVTDHINSFKQKLPDDLCNCKLEHLPHKLVKGEVGLQIAWGFLRRTVPSRFLHVLRGSAVEVTSEFCDDMQETIHRMLAQWTDQGGLTAGQQRIVELPIEHGGLGSLPVKDLAAIARLLALAPPPDNKHTRSFREPVIDKEGLDLETRLQPKMETPPREIVGNVHILPAGRSAKAISRHLTKSYLAKSYKDAWMYADHFVPQLKHCWLRNVNKHSLKAGQGAPGMGHWLYTLPTAPFAKVANGPFKVGPSTPIWLGRTWSGTPMWQHRTT